MIIIYIIIALYAFLIAFTRFTSALTTLVPDFSNLLGILMQLFFWATPVVWSVTRLAGHQKILEIIDICENNSISYNIYTEETILAKKLEYIQ